MRRDKKGEPRTSRVAGLLALGCYVAILTIAIVQGSWRSGWIVFLFLAGLVLKLVEIAVLDEHRTRIAAGASPEEWAKKYRGH